MKKHLLGMSAQELKVAAEEAGAKGFAGKQIAQWIYGKRVTEIDSMTNLSAKVREALKGKYCVGRREPKSELVSKDGTKKYLFEIGDEGSGKYVEAVYIPEEDRATLCVSCQVGCKMNCAFCMTGRQGYSGSLTAGEILNQIFSIPDSERLTNIVYMGMGEPMDNLDEVMRSLEVLTSDYGLGWSPKRITVSTVGLMQGMRRFLQESKCHLAVSLHNPFHEERMELMPVEKAYRIEEIIEEIKRYDFSGQRRVSFEYTVFKGWNDSPRHAKALADMLRGLECRINLIRFHSIPDSELCGASDKEMETFRDRLNAHGITATIRRSRGEDIYAACGLLSKVGRK